MNAELILGASLIAVSVGGSVIISFRNIAITRGPRERRFAIRSSFALFALIAGFIASLFYLNAPWVYLAAVLWLVVLTAVHYKLVTWLQIIRNKEHSDKHAPHPSSDSEMAENQDGKPE